MKCKRVMYLEKVLVATPCGGEIPTARSIQGLWMTKPINKTAKGSLNTKRK
jgi:hypothetical protein